jgi:hypothetical protein
MDSSQTHEAHPNGTGYGFRQIDRLAYAAALAREEELTPLSTDAHKTRREPAGGTS